MISLFQLGQFGRSLAAAAAGAWRTAFNWSPYRSGSSSGWNGYSYRQVIASSLLGGSGTKLKVTVIGNAALSIGEAYVQIAASSGDAYDFDSTPVQILWSGSGSVAPGAATPATSDEVSLTFDGTRNLVLSFYFNGTTEMYAYFAAPENGTTVTGYYRSGNSAATVNAATHTTYNSSYVIDKLELM